jgi:2-C-methyl-D-erythritol 4-phosphate cytidylyltransferase
MFFFGGFQLDNKLEVSLVRISALILASGTGLRFGDNQPKQFTKLAGLPVLVHTLKSLDTFPGMDKVIVVTNEEFVAHAWDLVGKYGLKKVHKVVSGGSTRQESSRIGLECCDPDTEYVLIHDGVRPFISHQVLRRLVDGVKEHGAVDTVIPSADTLVEIDERNFIRNIPDRSRFRRGQTPQAFSYPLILDAHRRARADGIENSTDDCALVLRMGHPVYAVEGEEQNIKITYPLDLHLADKLFQLNTLAPPASAGKGKDLENKVVVIVGGTQGIGRSIAELLRCRASAKVFALGRNSIPAIDLTDHGSLEAVFGEIFLQEGRIDYVINCAGDLIRKNVANMSLEEWDFLYRVNVSGNFYLAKALMPIWEKQKSGNLMVVGSSSYTRGRGGYAAYSSSKAALVNFCQALAEEVDCWNVKVNVASPGRVQTGLRLRNFGQEPPESLLSPDFVAEQVVAALTMDTTGSVFEIR